VSRAGSTLAQAKVNLALRVLGKRPDGFHSIETVFLRLALGDDVRVHIRGRTRTIRCGVLRDEPKEANLAFRAAALYADVAGWPTGFEIAIKKRIPVGGGLGGGSADAAAVLRILNTLAPTPLPSEHLLEVALRIGSDVPFQTSSHAMALAWGRGEKLLELQPLPARDIDLLIPPYGVSSSAAYAALAQTRSAESKRPPELTAEMFADWPSVMKSSVNDFEGVIRKDHPEIDAWLKAGEEADLLCRMTGSGSTVFVMSGAERDAAGERIQALRSLPPDSRRISTRTATSVVPVEVLD
jgi:4-diphosphocytidyl-2-C-methyl-D-erythritol kinase